MASWAAQYIAAVKRTDVLLGRVLNTVDNRPGLRRHTLVLLTADHGGRGGSHYAAGKLRNFRIPFMAWGPGVPAGLDLYRLNPTFRSPGSSRTTYRGKQPIRNGDLANLPRMHSTCLAFPARSWTARAPLICFASRPVHRRRQLKRES